MERAGYAEIQQLLNGLVTRYGWRPMMEGGELHRKSSCRLVWVSAETGLVKAHLLVESSRYEQMQ